MRRTFILVFIFLFLAGLAWAEQLELRVFKVQRADVRSLDEILEKIKSNEGKVSVDSNTNSVIVFDYPSVLDRVAGIIKALDVAEKQVEIKVNVVEATSDFLEDIGLTSSQVVIPSGEFSAMLNLISQSKNAHLDSQMSVRTLSNHPARLQITTDEVIGQTTTYYSSGATVTAVERRPIGEFLEALPIVNNDNTITLTLRPSSSTLQDEHTPYERTILTQVVIKDKDTLAIGGLDSQKEETTTQKIPFLGIPTGQKKTSAGKKTIFFLTVNIVE